MATPVFVFPERFKDKLRLFNFGLCGFINEARSIGATMDIKNNRV